MGNFAHVPNYVAKAEDPQGGLLPLLRDNADLQAEFKVRLLFVFSCLWLSIMSFVLFVYVVVFARAVPF
jgi:hypothetical protein